MPSSSPTSHKISFSYGDIAKLFLLHFAYYCIEVSLLGQHNSQTVFMYILCHGLIFLPGIILSRQRYGMNSTNNAPRITGSTLVAEYFRNARKHPLTRLYHSVIFQLITQWGLTVAFVDDDMYNGYYIQINTVSIELPSLLSLLRFICVIPFPPFIWRYLYIVVAIFEHWFITYSTNIHPDEDCFTQLLYRLNASETNHTIRSRRIIAREALLQTSFGTLGLLSSWILLDRKLSRIRFFPFYEVFDLILVIVTYFSAQALLAFAYVDSDVLGRTETESKSWKPLSWFQLIQWLRAQDHNPFPYDYLQEFNGKLFSLLRLFLRVSLCVMLALKTWKRYKTFSAEDESHSHEW